MKLRVTTEDDGELIGTLLRQSYPVLMRAAYPDSLLRLALPLMTRANPALLTSGTYYVATDEAGRAIGCGGWTLERPGSGELSEGLAHVRHFATHPECTGQGIGRAVYNRCEEHARSAGANRFECYSSLNAEGFYRAIGFSAHERFEATMGPDVRVPAVLMKKSI